ncbi:MAG: hypothetical protein DSM106950_37695 [Stigonema ocellatum SAG 48.90 = DSM 106950]|nr:hypothetical protein [Stigonema ocellatum SAG 48.90 = DSM 106950]
MLNGNLKREAIAKLETADKEYQIIAADVTNQSIASLVKSLNSGEISFDQFTEMSQLVYIESAAAALWKCWNLYAVLKRIRQKYKQ